MIKYLVNRNENFKNIELYAFDDIKWIGNIDLYKDFTHYNAQVNSFIIKSIANKEHQLNLKNLENYINDLNIKIKNVNFDYYYNEIKKITK